MNKKIFITLFAFIGFMFFFNCSNVFAYSFNYRDYNYDLGDLPFNTNENKYFVILNPDNASYNKVQGGNVATIYVFYTPSIFKFKKASDNSLIVSSDVDYYFISYSYVLDGKNKGKFWISNSGGNPACITKGSTFNIGAYYGGSLDNLGVAYSNYDMVFEDTGETFFQPAPQEEEQKPTSTLQVAPTLTSTDLSGILAQILAILPVVLMVLISLLALRKAIHLLSKILDQA